MKDKYRIYDSKSGRFVPDSMLHVSAIMPSGEVGVVDENGNFENRNDRYVVSWYTGWQDVNGEEVYGGDVLKRFRDFSAEHEREWLEEQEYKVSGIDRFVTDRSGAIGVVHRKPGGYTIKLIEGHKWAFYGPEGSRCFDWDKEVKVIGNKWQNSDLL